MDKQRIENAFREILIAIGEDPDREGLLETPARVARMYEEIFSGLEDDPSRHLKLFNEKGNEEMVIVRDIPLYSMCEHHLLPFVGKAHIAYIPSDGKIIGLSKLARIVNTFARRPQVQERLTTQIADFLSEVSLMSDIEENDTADDERITLMTVHSAKGLEFRTVFIVGLEEDLFPNQSARESLREMEEERRLLYVAITRAKDHCILSFAKSRYKYGQFGFCEPSCFIKEINPAYIVIPNGGAAQQRQPQQQSFRSGGMFGATNNFGRRSVYGQEENSRPQFSRTGSTAVGRAFEQQKSSEQSPRVATPSSYTSRPANLYRVSDIQRYGQSSANTLRTGLSVGSIVQHDRFGVGEVQSTEGVGENAKATIKFQNAGVKTLLLKFAKLKIIG